MTSTPPFLFVAWQNPEKRGIRVVGRLRNIGVEEQSRYEFAYLKGALDAQQEYGFRPFLAFPELGDVYFSDTLFPFFTNRVLRSTRRDYPAYIEDLGLTLQDATPERILSRSGGKRVTDHVEIFAPPERAPESGIDEMFFLLRGLRYMPPATEERIAALAPGDRLHCMLDFQNSYNQDAVALRTEDNYLLGYMPDYLVEDVARLRERDEPLAVLVHRVNPPPAPQGHRLLCRLQARWPADHKPFTDERFQPIVPLPEDTSATPQWMAQLGS